MTVPEDVSRLLGLSLGYGISFQPTTQHSMNKERFLHDIRIKFIEIPENADNGYDPKLKLPFSQPHTTPAPMIIKDNVERFFIKIDEAFLKSQRRKHKPNLNKKDIRILRQLKKERKFIIVNTDKNLGPAIIELDHYIHRSLEDHLNDKTTYRELSKFKADALNKINFCWVCENCIDNPACKLMYQEDKFFQQILGKRDSYGRCHMEYNILLPYFYMMPKVHKKPDWKTRPVISSVSLVLEPLSKFLDVQLQKVVHLCPAYLKDSWQFLNNIRYLNNLTGYSLVTADAVLMYININTEHAISTFADWFKLHNKDIPSDFPRDLIHP